MDILERKLRDSIAIYAEQVVRVNNVTPEAIDIVKTIATSGMLTGLSAASGILAQLDGSDDVTAQAMLRAVERIAADHAADTQTIYI